MAVTLPERPWKLLEKIQYLTWPLSALSLGDIESPSARYINVGITIVANSVLYALVGAILWALFFRSKEESK